MSNSYISIPTDSLEKLKGLSGTTYYIYLLFRSKLRYKKGTKPLTPTTNIITFTFSEANKLGIAKSVFSKAINNLLKVKLLTIKKRGKLGGRQPTEYKIN